MVALGVLLALLLYGQQGRSRWGAAWDVLNCCKWDGACPAQGFKSPWGVTAHVALSPQPAEGHLGCSRWQGQVLCTSWGILVGWTRTSGHPWWPRDISVPSASSQQHGRFSAPSPCRFSCQGIAHSPIVFLDGRVG